jgi:hypothetical protein
MFMRCLYLHWLGCAGQGHIENWPARANILNIAPRREQARGALATTRGENKYNWKPGALAHRRNARDGVLPTLGCGRTPPAQDYKRSAKQNECCSRGRKQRNNHTIAAYS